jgi:hypothetical protein
MGPAWEQDYIMVAVKVAPVEHEAVIGAIAPKEVDKAKVQAAQAVAAGNAAKDDGERLVRVLVNEGSGKEGKRPVKTSVNGIQYLVTRGTPVTIKKKFMGALDNAVRTEYEQDPDDHENMIVTHVHNYPFQFLGYVDEAPKADAG